MALVVVTGGMSIQEADWAGRDARRDVASHFLRLSRSAGAEMKSCAVPTAPFYPAEARQWDGWASGGRGCVWWKTPGVLARM